MNKFLTLMAATLVATASASASTVYTADLSAASADDFASWTVIDANQDGSTWKYDADAAPSRVFYNYNSANQADDWLISPAIEIPADGSYVVSYEYKGSAYSEAFEVYTGAAPTVEGMTAKIAEYNAVKDDVAGDLIFIDAKAGKLHIGFHCTSNKDLFRLYINKVSVIEASNPVDLQVSKIIAPISGEGMGQEAVTVEVTNSGRVAVDSYDIAYSIDGGAEVTEHVTEPIAVGATATYTFKAKADLSQGHKTYTISARTIHADDLNPANDGATASVRHIAPATVPYSMGFEPDEDTDGITFLNLNDDDGDWGINIDGGFFGSFSRTGYGCLAYNYSKNAADDWAFLEPIKMEAGHYVIKYWYSATAGHPERLRVCYGNAPTPEAMTNVLAVYDPMTNDKYLEAIHIFELKEAGDIYFGFYAFSDEDENWILIDDLSIETVDANTFDLSLSNLASPSAYMRPGNAKTFAFTMQNIGIIEAKTNVKFYIDDKLAGEKSYTLRPMEILNVSETGLYDNLTAGEHTVKIVAACDADKNLDNSTLTSTFRYLDSPLRLWTFEDAQLPAEFTYRVEDSAQNHPDAGAEFNEQGFGIFDLEHPVLETKALAVNTWFTESRTADRWIVLPQFTVNSDDAHFVWNANSFNPSFPERYDVKVSKTDDVWYSYSSEVSIEAEEVSPQTRGIDLGKYKGETVYVAVNVRTANGEALILDNFGLYGDLSFASSGIENVSGETGFEVSVNGGVVTVSGEEAATIAVYTLEGNNVAQTRGSSADISSLGSGVYIVRVTAASGTRTVKVRI